jgi:hypothetical protein
MKEEILANINAMAGEGLQTIGIAYSRVTVSPRPFVPIEASSIPSPFPNLKVERSAGLRGRGDGLWHKSSTELSSSESGVVCICTYSEAQASPFSSFRAVYASVSYTPVMRRNRLHAYSYSPFMRGVFTVTLHKIHSECVLRQDLKAVRARLDAPTPEMAITFIGLVGIRDPPRKVRQRT